MTDDVLTASTQAPLSLWVRLSLAVMSVGAAAIHFAVVGEHFDEAVIFGLFFAVVGWLQAGWAIAMVAIPTYALTAAGLVGNAAVVAVWAVSRTAGLPIGPEAGEPEPTTFIDVLATVLELLIAAIALVALVRPGTERWLRGRVGVVATVALLLLVVPTTTVAIATSGEHRAHRAEENLHDVTGHEDEAP
jgi:hypothetical protein